MADDIEDYCASGADEAAAFRTSLLNWYDTTHRKLPWRYNPHSQTEIKSEIRDEQLRAYSVWVSEMMLQQTRVVVVEKYYAAWMEKWPSLRDLAQATQEEVNSAWAGLGYYRRARFLLEGAKYIVEQCGGDFPTTATELQQIPGIGRYTAGAIASVVFNQQVPVVDGNVVRVLCRLRAIPYDIKKASTVKLLWDLADTLVDPQRPGDLNQALMELGAVLCTPSKPKCQDCPISASCRARQLAAASKGAGGLVSVTDFPVKTRKAPPREEFAAVCVVELSSGVDASSSLLMVQRPATGLLAGLWEFPSVKLPSSTSPHEEAMKNYLESLGAVLHEFDSPEHVGNYTHVFSHIRLNMRIERLRIRSNDIPTSNSAKTRWVKQQEVAALGLTSGVKKVFDMFCEHCAVSLKRKRDAK